MKQYEQVFSIPAGTDFGIEALEDTVLIEASLSKGKVMVKNRALNLNEAVPYKENQIVNMDAIQGNNGKFALMAFDKGTGLESHAAPGEALVTALDGEGIIYYEGTEYELHAGESFRFVQGGKRKIQNESSSDSS